MRRQTKNVLMFVLSHLFWFSVFCCFLPVMASLFISVALVVWTYPILKTSLNNDEHPMMYSKDMYDEEVR